MAKKDNNKTNNDQEPQNDSSFIDSKLLNKLFGPIKVLIKMHLKVAKKELKKDMARYIAGMITFIIGLMTLINLWLLLNIIIVLLFHNFIFVRFQSIYNILFSVLATSGANLLFFIIMITITLKQFKKPFLEETKKVVQETLNDLK